MIVMMTAITPSEKASSREALICELESDMCVFYLSIFLAATNEQTPQNQVPYFARLHIRADFHRPSFCCHPSGGSLVCKYQGRSIAFIHRIEREDVCNRLLGSN
jgi:hypothetical protein